MSRDLDKLVNDYQSMQASPYLATRIEAHVNAEQPGKGRGWWPALGGGAVAVVIGVMIALPLMAPSESNANPVAAYSVPGFSQLASAHVSDAVISPPSFSNLRSVETPVLPAKPVL